jgi:hypothetical protein
MPFGEITEKFSERALVITFCRERPEIFANPSCHFFIRCPFGTGFYEPFSVIFLFYKLKPRGL